MVVLYRIGWRLRYPASEKIGSIDRTIGQMSWYNLILWFIVRVPFHWGLDSYLTFIFVHRGSAAAKKSSLVERDAVFNTELGNYSFPDVTEEISAESAEFVIILPSHRKIWRSPQPRRTKLKFQFFVFLNKVFHKCHRNTHGRWIIQTVTESFSPIVDRPARITATSTIFPLI